MQIFRRISVARIEDLDLNNLGCHWTRDYNYQHTGGGYNGLTENKGVSVLISATVKKSQINEAATAESNLYHPKEKEIVLNENQVVKITYRASGDWNNIITATANTGNRVDQWVKNM